MRTPAQDIESGCNRGDGARYARNESALDVLLDRWGRIQRQLRTGELDSYGYTTAAITHTAYGSRLPRLPKDHDRTYQLINPYIDHLKASSDPHAVQAVHVLDSEYTEGGSVAVRKAYQDPLGKHLSAREYNRRLSVARLLLSELVRLRRPDVLNNCYSERKSPAEPKE